MDIVFITLYYARDSQNTQQYSSIREKNNVVFFSFYAIRYTIAYCNLLRYDIYNSMIIYGITGLY